MERTQFKPGHVPWLRGNHERYAGEKNPFYNKHHSAESKKEMSDKRKSLWREGSYAKKIFESLQLKPNGAELYLDSVLQNNFPDEWKFVGDGNCIINGLCPDFINCNGKKQIIEVFGEHCHKDKKCFAGKETPYRQTEQGRKEAFAELGYSTLIIWWSELADEGQLIQKIKYFR
jgi:hypothetical protein